MPTLPSRNKALLKDYSSNHHDPFRNPLVRPYFLWEVSIGGVGRLNSHESSAARGHEINTMRRTKVKTAFNEEGRCIHNELQERRSNGLLAWNCHGKTLLPPNPNPTYNKHYLVGFNLAKSPNMGLGLHVTMKLRKTDPKS